MSDWKARAEREAAAILAEAGVAALGQSYKDLIALVALGWLQGANYGDHERLSLIEDAFDELRASL